MSHHGNAVGAGAAEIYERQRITVFHCACKRTAGRAGLRTTRKSICIEYYKPGDLTLSQYLREVCFNPAIMAQSSSAAAAPGADSAGASEQTLSYTHHHGRLTVQVVENPSLLKQAVARAEGGQGAGSTGVLTWSECKQTGKATRARWLSEQALCYSFGCFLEASFHNTSSRCEATGSRVFRDHTRYFGCRGLIATFKWEPVVAYECIFPPTQQQLSDHSGMKDEWQRDVNHLFSWANIVCREGSALLGALAAKEEDESRRQKLLGMQGKLGGESILADAQALLKSEVWVAGDSSIRQEHSLERTLQV